MATVCLIVVVRLLLLRTCNVAYVVVTGLVDPASRSAAPMMGHLGYDEQLNDAFSWQVALENSRSEEFPGVHLHPRRLIESEWILGMDRPKLGRVWFVWIRHGRIKFLT